ncbi:hypothetical protein LPJ64_000318 [Coemansia asiatica]|uniref:Uncharacterized protein n=1 Tax=Coemansia asiatica TaxID=1052880 RepID=A0A9W7XS45_9FUNG|nr:hypothetical protein LPJ64_000318 [Coemansia asiatica]
MDTSSAQAVLSGKDMAQRRSRTRISPYDGAMEQSTPRVPERYKVRWEGLDEDLFSNSKSLADESCIKLVSDDDSDVGIESDDPTNTAMFLVESEENELKQIVPGTPQAFSKLGQLTVQSINRQRISQTPGKTPSHRGTGNHGSASRRSSSKSNNGSSKSFISTEDSPSKRGKAAQIESLGPPVPVFQLPSPPKEKMASANGANVPKSVRILNSSRRAEMILDKIKASEKTAERPAVPKASSPAEQRKRMPIKPDFERNEFAPIEFPILVASNKGNNASGKQSEHQSADSSLMPLNKEKAAASSDKSAISKDSRVGEPQREQQEGNVFSSTAGSANEQADYLLQTPPPKKSASLRRAGDIPKTPITEQMKRIKQLRTFLSKPEKQSQQFTILGTPAQAARRMSEADRTRLVLGKSPSENRSNGISDSLSAQVPKFSLPLAEQQDMSAINLIDSMSFSQISSIHEDSIEHEEDNHASQQQHQLLLSFSSSRHGDSSGNRDIAHQHRGTEIAAYRGSGSQETSHVNLMDMSLQLTQSIAVLDGGLQSQLQLQLQRQSGPGAPELSEVADAVERANIELDQNPVNENGLATHVRSDELEGQVKTLRETMTETKDIVFSIRQELDQQKHGQHADDSKLDDIVRLLGALDMRLHMLEDRQQQSLKANPTKASSSGSIKVAAAKPASQQKQKQQQDIFSLIGLLFVNCLAKYPLRIIGALFIVLVLELITISGLGSRAMYELKNYLPVPPAPPS